MPTLKEVRNFMNMKEIKKTNNKYRRRKNYFKIYKEMMILMINLCIVNMKASEGKRNNLCV